MIKNKLYEIISIISLIVNIYIIFAIPYKIIGYYLNENYSTAFYVLTILDFTVSIAVLIELILKIYNHKMVQKTKEEHLKAGVITEIPVLPSKYPKLSFLLDLLVIIPYAPILQAIRYRESCFIYIIWFVHLHSMPLIVKYINKMLKENHIIKNVDAIRLFWMFLLFCGFSYIFCAIFILIDIPLIRSRSDCWMLDQGLVKYFDDGTYAFVKSESFILARSLYYTVGTVVTTGYGDIVSKAVPETVCTLVMMYIGFIFVIIIVSTITTMVSSLSKKRSEHMKEMDLLNEYMRYRHLDVILQTKIRRFNEYLWSQTEGVDEEEFQDNLPISLQNQVIGATGGNLVKDIPFFKDQDPGFLNLLVEHLEQEFFSPGDTILQVNNPTTEITFLIRGEAEKYKGGVLQSIITTATAFYEYAPFLPEPTTMEFTLIARSYCNVSILSKAVYNKAAIKTGHTQADRDKISEAAAKYKESKKKMDKLLGAGGVTIGEIYKGWKKIFLPNSTFRSICNIIAFFGVVWYILVVPLQFGYFYSGYTSKYIAVTVINYMVDIFFFIDLIFRMLFYSYTDSGVAVCNKKKIFQHYRENDHIYMDLIAVLPIDLIFFGIDHRYVSVVRFLKLFRAINIGEYKTVLIETLQRVKISITSTLQDFIMWMCIVFLYAHYVGCGWLFFGHFEFHRVGQDIENTDDWFTNDEYNPNFDIDHNRWGGLAGYIRAIYWAMISITTVGYGDIVAVSLSETLYATIAILIGGLMYPSTVGALSSVMGQFGATQKSFKHKVAVIRRYMGYKHIDKDLQERIQRYYDYIWSRQQGVDEVSILIKLPKPLRIKVSDSINGEAFNNIIFFKMDVCEKELLDELFSVLIPVTFLPDDIIIDLYEVGKGFFYLTKGTARIDIPSEPIEDDIKNKQKTRASIYADALNESLKKQPRMSVSEALLKSTDTVTPQLKSVIMNDNLNSSLVSSFNQAGINVLPVVGFTITKEKSRQLGERKLSKLVIDGRLKQAVPKIDINPKEIPVSTLLFVDRGGYFGTNSLINMPSSRRVVAVSYCDCYLLPTDETLDIIKTTPDTDTFIESVHDELTIEAKIERSVQNNIKNYTKLGSYMGKDVSIKHHFVSPKSLFHPESLARHLWNTLCLIIVTYNVFMIPIRIVIPIESYVSFIPDWIFDVFMIIDLYMTTHYFAYMYEGELISEKEEISKHYRKTTSYWFSLISSIPWDFIIIPIVLSNGTSHLSFMYLAILRLPKLLRYWDYDSFFMHLRRIAENYPFIPENLPKVTQLLLTVLLIGHIFGCILLALGRYGNTWDWNMEECSIYDRNDDSFINEHGCNNYSDCLYHDTWIQMQIQWDLIPTDGGANTLQYLKSIYFSTTTLLACVIGDTIPITDLETLVVLILLLIGVAVSSAIIGDVANIAADLGTESGIMRSKQEDLEKYLIAIQAPPEIKQNAMEFFDYLWDSCGGFDEDSILQDLPETLRLEVNTIKQTYIRKCDLFSDLPEPAIKELAKRLISVVYCPNDYIYKQGKTCPNIYFIKSGEVRLLDEDDEIVRLGENDIFGENSVFYDLRARESAQSISYTELYYISRQDLDKVYKKFITELDNLLDKLCELPSFDDYDEAKTNKQKKKYAEKTATSNNIMEKDKNMFKPHSTFMRIWNFIGFFFISYYIFTIPFCISYYTIKELKSFSTVFPVIFFDVLGYIYFYVDIYLRYNYICFKRNGAIVTDKKEISKHYRNSRFWSDVLSVIPLELFSPINITLYPFFRLIHIFKMVGVTDYLDDISDTLIHFIPKLNSAMLRMLRIIIILLIINHVSGCVFFFLHRFCVPNAELTWAIRDGLSTYDPLTGTHNVHDDNISFWYCYLRSIYYTMQMLASVGLGDIRPYTAVGTSFNIIFAFVSSCEMAAFIGMFSAFLEQLDRGSNGDFDSKIEKYEVYMKNRQFPDLLQKNIIYQYTSVFHNQNNVMRPDCVDELPELLQSQITYNILRDRIIDCNGLKYLEEDVLIFMSKFFLLYFCRKDENLYKKKDIGNEVYFISSGEVQLTSDDSKKNKDLSKGDHFGDDILRDDKCRRRNNAWTTTECELLTITKERILLLYYRNYSCI